MTTDQLSTNELISRLEKEGILITHRQLVRWQNYGAITRPTKQSLGRKKGSVTLYPSSTISQIKTLQQYLDNKRSIDQAIFDLWIDGFTVDMKQLCNRSIKKYRKKIDCFYSKVAGDIVLTEDAYTFIEGRLISKPLRKARKHIRKAHFPDIVEIILRLLTGITRSKGDEGSYPSITEQQIDILVQSFGDEYAPIFNNQVRGFYSRMRADLDYLASIISLDHLYVLLNNSTDNDLKVAYNFFKQVRDILIHIPSFRETITPLFQIGVNQQVIFTMIALAFLKDPSMQAKFQSMLK